MKLTETIFCQQKMARKIEVVIICLINVEVVYVDQIFSNRPIEG